MGRHFEVSFTSRAFPGFVPRRGILTFSADHLAHALFVTGRAPGDRVAHGDASVYEFVHRAMLIPAYIREVSGERLMKSALAEDLDRSEKVALSYALGQAMTTVFCTQVLGARFLMHLDRYAARWRMDFGTGRSRPDLFGRIPRKGWLVAESKGRSNAMEPSLPVKIASQKSMVKSIAGHAPAVSLGCVASFPRDRFGGHLPMRVDAVDPDPDEQGSILDIKEAAFVRAYYEPFVAAVNLGEEVSGDADTYVLSEYGSLGLRVGLRRDLYELFADGSTELAPADVARVLDEDPPEVSETDPGGTAFPDGTVIHTSWDDALTLPDAEGRK